MNSTRKLTLNRETVRVLTSREMLGIAGGADDVTWNCPLPGTKDCPKVAVTIAACPLPPKPKPCTIRLM
jgi:natural product precursor